MKKRLEACLALCLVLAMVLSLAACAGPSGGGDGTDSGESAAAETPDTDTGPVTSGTDVQDVDFGDSETHEELAKLEFEPGEPVGSVYYKVCEDPETNQPAYMVKHASDGEVRYLPLTKTVRYVDEMLGDRAYYERVPLQYVQDEQQVETFQYQIFVSAFAPGDDGSRYAEAQDHGDGSGGSGQADPAAEPAESR